MVTAKSIGVTATERLLAEFCERSILKLWSYPNPYKDDAHELCDLLAVFENHVFIFFDRDNELADSSDKDQQVGGKALLIPHTQVSLKAAIPAFLHHATKNLNACPENRHR
jgi:hypothetical protein